MEKINIICSIIMFLYLSIIFLLNYYKNLCLKRKNRYLMEIENINPTMNFYCCDLLNSTKLFWITLIELVDKKYYKLYEKENVLYLKAKKINKDIKILDYQQNVIEYLNNIFENEEEIAIEQLDYKVRKDCNTSSVMNNYLNSLRKNTREAVGDLDRLDSYKFPFVYTFLYSLQVLYFLSNEINAVGKILIALPFTYFTVVISDLLKNKIGLLTKKKYIIVFISSLIVSLATSIIWTNDYNNNYLGFHFLMGIFTYMYPMLIVINTYVIRTNYAYKNKIQKDLMEQMNSLDQKDIKNIDYLYLKVLKIKSDTKDEIIDKYFEILDL